VPNLDPIVQKLDTTRRDLLRAADLVPFVHWQTPPNEGRWCAGAVIGHLTMVERYVLSSADSISQKPPKQWPFYRRFHLPFAIIERRVLKRKAPQRVQPEVLAGKEEMLAEFREVRERTLAFLDETKTRDLSEYRWPHPFIGTLNVYEWLLFLGSHEVRHTKQMREIVDSLPKSVASSRN
jgi:uncharacterized damage-inducible protein DinB